MIHSIPFSIPTEFAEGLSNGRLIRIGTLLKESATGKIVAHIQETGLAQQLLSGIGISPFSPLATATVGLNLASSGFANVQLAQLKAMLEGLQILQYANLGVSVAGIGVSVFGFAMINKRLKGIEGHISILAEKMDRHFQDWSERELRKHYSQVYVLFEKAESASTLTNSSDELRRVESQLADEGGFFRGEIAHILKQDKFDVDLFTSFVRCLALCNSGRIECLLLANEMPAAYKVADLIGQNYKELFDDMSQFQLASKVSHNHSDWSQHGYSIFRQYQNEMKAIVQGIRDVTDAALTRPLLIETLIENEIAGQDFISALRSEREQPLLLLRHKQKV